MSAATPRQRIHTCTVCRRSGHNRRTCPRVIATRRNNRRRRTTQPRPHIDFIREAMTGMENSIEFRSAEQLTDDIVTISRALLNLQTNTSRNQQRLEAMKIAVRHCSLISQLQIDNMKIFEKETEKVKSAISIIGKLVNPGWNINESKDCPICFENITGPKLVCNNGHSICNVCVSKMLELSPEGHKCPMCRVDL